MFVSLLVKFFMMSMVMCMRGQPRAVLPMLFAAQMNL